MDVILHTNKLALSKLQAGYELETQNLLKQNLHASKCCLTLNNLGVFYCQYGIISKNRKIRSGLKRGFALLLQATKHEQNVTNLVNIASAAMELKKNRVALYHLRIALSISTSSILRYNIAACLYRQREFSAVIELCRTFPPNEAAMIVENDGVHPLLLLAGCHIQLGEKQLCANCIDEYRKFDKTGNLFDIFFLRYFCGLYEEALSECSLLLDEWYPTTNLLVAIADCLDKTPHYSVKLNIPEAFAHTWNTIQKRKHKHHFVDYNDFVPPFIHMYSFIKTD